MLKLTFYFLPRSAIGVSARAPISARILLSDLNSRTRFKLAVRTREVNARVVGKS